MLNIFILVKSWGAIILPALLFTKIPLRSKDVHVFPSLGTYGVKGMLLKILTPFFLKQGMDFNYLGLLKVWNTSQGFPDTYLIHTPTQTHPFMSLLYSLNKVYKMYNLILSYEIV